MSHESQVLWVGLPNRSPSTWTQIIKDKFRWFLSNFGDSARFLLALGSVEEGPSTDKQRNVLNDQEGFRRSNLHKRVEGTWFCSSWTDYWQVLARPRIDLHPSQVVCNSRVMLWGCWLFFIFCAHIAKVQTLLHTRPQGYIVVPSQPQVGIHQDKTNSHRHDPTMLMYGFLFSILPGENAGNGLMLRCMILIPWETLETGLQG